MDILEVLEKYPNKIEVDSYYMTFYYDSFKILLHKIDTQDEITMYFKLLEVVKNDVQRTKRK